MKFWILFPRLISKIFQKLDKKTFDWISRKFLFDIYNKGIEDTNGNDSKSVVLIEYLGEIIN